MKNLTVIQQEIERHKGRRKQLKESCDMCPDKLFRNFYKGSLAELEETIKSLESLLEPEKRQIENAFTDGAICMDQLKNHEYPNYQHGEDYYKNKYESE